VIKASDLMGAKWMLFRLSAAGVAGAFLLIGSALAQSPALTLEGKVKQPQHWIADDLAKMPAEHVEVSYQTEHGPVNTSFTGVLLWSLIDAAGGLDDPKKGAAVRHAIRLTASDGYIVVTSAGEISPDFGGKAAIIAYERDGKPLGGFQLVMPGDKRGGRNIHDIATIEIE
jgi:hypothetical protein